MTIKTKLQFKDYIRLMFLMTYRRPLIVLLNCIGVIELILSVLYFAGFENLRGNIMYEITDNIRVNDKEGWWRFWNWDI